MQCGMPNSTAYLYACSFKRRIARRAKPPLNGAKGMQRSMPNSTAFHYACSLMRRTLRRAKLPHAEQCNEVSPPFPLRPSQEGHNGASFEATGMCLPTRT